MDRRVLTGAHRRVPGVSVVPPWQRSACDFFEPLQNLETKAGASQKAVIAKQAIISKDARILVLDSVMVSPITRRFFSEDARGVRAEFVSDV